MGRLKIRWRTRCKCGEVYIEGDQYGRYECCLQCGYTRDLPDLEPETSIVWPVASEKEAMLVPKARLVSVRK